MKLHLAFCSLYPLITLIKISFAPFLLFRSGGRIKGLSETTLFPSIKSLRSLCFILLCLLGQVKALEEISYSEVFCLEKTGNNQNEAKIAALHDGMRRALLIFADRLGIKLRPLQEKEPSYAQLKSCTQIEAALDQKMQQNLYRGTLRIACITSKTLEVLSKFAQNQGQILAIKRRLKNTIKDFHPSIGVIPVFKKNRLQSVGDTKWSEAWKQEKHLLQQSGIIELKAPEGEANLMTGEGLESHFPNCPPTLVVACAELFTDREGFSSCSVNYRAVSNGNEEILNSKTPYLQSSDEAMRESVRDFCLKESIRLKGAIKAKPTLERRIALRIYVRDLKALPSTIESLRTLGQIKVKTQTAGCCLASLRTSLDDYLLAEQLYMKGLGYIREGQSYRLLQLHH